MPPISYTLNPFQRTFTLEPLFTPEGSFFPTTSTHAWQNLMPGLGENTSLTEVAPVEIKEIAPRPVFDLSDERITAYHPKIEPFRPVNSEFNNSTVYLHEPEIDRTTPLSVQAAFAYETYSLHGVFKRWGRRMSKMELGMLNDSASFAGQTLLRAICDQIAILGAVNMPSIFHPENITDWFSLKLGVNFLVGIPIAYYITRFFNGASCFNNPLILSATIDKVRAHYGEHSPITKDLLAIQEWANSVPEIDRLKLLEHELAEVLKVNGYLGYLGYINRIYTDEITTYADLHDWFLNHPFHKDLVAIIGNRTPKALKFPVIVALLLVATPYLMYSNAMLNLKWVLDQIPERYEGVKRFERAIPTEIGDHLALASDLFFGTFCSTVSALRFVFVTLAFSQTPDIIGYARDVVVMSGVVTLFRVLANTIAGKSDLSRTDINTFRLKWGIESGWIIGGICAAEALPGEMKLAVQFILGASLVADSLRVSKSYVSQNSLKSP